MDVDDGIASSGKKKKERVLVERTGNAWYRECVSRKAACLVEEVQVKKWKQLAVEGTVLMHKQEAYMLLAGVGKGVDDDEVCIKVKLGRE